MRNNFGDVTVSPIFPWMKILSTEISEKVPAMRLVTRLPAMPHLKNKGARKKVLDNRQGTAVNRAGIMRICAVLESRAAMGATRVLINFV
jgi:hypothetical protein